MHRDATHHIDRIDEFGDESKRRLVTLTADGLRDTETWSSLDANGDLKDQHAALARRLHRLVKIRVRYYLNGLALACRWQVRSKDLAQGIVASGFDPSQLYFRGALEAVARVDLSPLLEVGCEEARLAGFVGVDEIRCLLQGEAIAVELDPRPADVPIGPPIVMTECE